MKRFLILGLFAMALMMAAPAMAADPPADGDGAGVGAAAHASGEWVFPDGNSWAFLGAAIGAGIVVFGAARGIGNIGGNAVQSIARQPEAGDRIFTSMLLSAALIEGVALFGVVVTLLIALKEG